MRVIGLAGRSGVGKSAVARALTSRDGVERIDLDSVAWETYRRGTPTFDRLVARFGRGILSADGSIDRRRLAASALAGSDERAALEAIVHPAVVEWLRRAIAEREARDVDVLLVEGALLVHSPHVDRSLFDAIVWLDACDATRADRLRGARRSDHAERVPEPPPDALAGVHRLSAEGTVAQVAERLVRWIETL